MNKTSDVIVIGAGVVGCSAAYYLAKAGLKVTVADILRIEQENFKS